MAVSVESRAKRILSKLEKYTSVDNDGVREVLSVAGWRDEYGEVLGIYEDEARHDGKIFICAFGIYSCIEDPIFFPYSEIKEINYDHLSESIGIKMTGAASGVLRVTGRQGNFFDSSEFVRFLDRVLSDQNAEEERGSE